MQMKIAFDAKRFFHNTSGLGNYSRDLVRILASFFPENNYLLLAKSKNDRGKEILELPNVSFIPISKAKFSRQLKMGFDAQNSEADIFHGLSGELPLKWSRSRPIKKIVTIHDLIFIHYPKFYSWFDRKIYLWKFKNAAHQADLVIAISEQTKRDIIQFLGVPESKIRVVYQGCHKAFKELPANDFLQTVKEKFNLPERFILSVGTIEERKNLLSVVKALKDTNIPLVVVGKKTHYFKKVEAFIKKNKIVVQFLQNVSMTELAALYRLADIFIYPSLCEGFGIPLIEAHFCGTVVITSNVSCLPEAGGEDSVYVNPLQIEDIKAKIIHLWNNEEERKRRAEKSLAFVEKFDDAHIAQSLIKVYKELI